MTRNKITTTGQQINGHRVAKVEEVHHDGHGYPFKVHGGFICTECDRRTRKRYEFSDIPECPL